MDLYPKETVLSTRTGNGERGGLLTNYPGRQFGYSAPVNFHVLPRFWPIVEAKAMKSVTPPRSVVALHPSLEDSNLYLESLPNMQDNLLIRFLVAMQESPLQDYIIFVTSRSNTIPTRLRRISILFTVIVFLLYQ